MWYLDQLQPGRKQKEKKTVLIDYAVRLTSLDINLGLYQAGTGVNFLLANGLLLDYLRMYQLNLLLVNNTTNSCFQH